MYQRQSLLLAAIAVIGFHVSAVAQNAAPGTPACAQVRSGAVATKLTSSAEPGFPTEAAWERAHPVVFCSDWQGKNTDAQRATEVRLLWSPETLWVRFASRYRELYLYPESNQRLYRLWDRDVAEMFIQPPGDAGSHRYKEFEVSPNGNWLDLDVVSGRDTNLNCDVKTRATALARTKMWTAELAIPLKCLTANFDPNSTWRVNFFRAEGKDPARFYSSWHATNTPAPNFHVPEVFGELRFKQ